MLPLSPFRCASRRRGSTRLIGALAILGLVGCAAAPLRQARLDLAAGRYQEASERLEALREEDPEAGEAHRLLARAAVELERFEGAERALRRARKLQPHGDPELDALHERIVRDLWNRAVEASERGEHAAAAGDFELLAALEPERSEVRKWLGLTLLASADTVAALRVFDELGAAGDRQVWEHKVAVELRRRRWETALGSASVALARFPDSAVLLRARACALDRLDRRAEAVVAYEQALVGAGPAVDLELARARLLMQLGDMRGALEAFEGAWEAPPGAGAAAWDAESYEHYGECLVELGRLAEGRAAFERSLAIEPEGRRAAQYLRLIASVVEGPDASP